MIRRPPGSTRTAPLFPSPTLFRSFAGAAGLSADLFRLAYALVGHRRGGLAMATIGGCAGFGAICGSSVATAATMARIALPEMQNRNYSPALATGRSEEHTSELQSLMRISYAVFCLKKKKHND